MKQVFAFTLLVVLFAGTIGPANVNSQSVEPGSLSQQDSLSKHTSIVGRDIHYGVLGARIGPGAPALNEADYPTILGESRLVIWIVAQQHLYWVAFVLGTFFIVTLLEVWSLIGVRYPRAAAYDGLAGECLDVVMLAVAVGSILGALLLISLSALYPDLTTYLIRIFRPVALAYGVLILAFTLLAYVYYVTWIRMSDGWQKWLHASLGVVVNVIGTTIAFLGNAWSSFMMSPSGVDQYGRYLGNIWHVIHSAVWNSFNLHRFSGHILCAAAVLVGFAACQALTAKRPEDRAHFDWMGSVMFLVLLGALLTIPFGSYWMLREIYAYRQQMGITLLGGLLAWLGVVLVTAMGLIFFATNYYLWQRIASMGGQSLAWASKWVFGLLALCVMVYITPHTLVMTMLELKLMGGQQHPVIGNYGVESAKSPAVNLIILITAWSFILWRCSHASTLTGDVSQRLRLSTLIFIVAGVNILWLGIYGYYIPANVRVGLSVPMVATTFSAIAASLVLTRKIGTQEWEKMDSREWGRLSVRGYYALLSLSILVIWIMGLGGYRRSSVRLFWHVNEIMRDASPWAYTHTTGFAANVITLNALVFVLGLFGVLWLAKMGCSQGQDAYDEATTLHPQALK